MTIRSFSHDAVSTYCLPSPVVSFDETVRYLRGDTEVKTIVNQCESSVTKVSFQDYSLKAKGTSSRKFGEWEDVG